MAGAIGNKWTTDQENQITSLYSILKGQFQQEANKRLFGGPQLPYLDAYNILNDIINKQEKPKPEGLEGKVAGAYVPEGHGRLSNAYGLAAVLGLVLGFPYLI